MPSAFLSVRLSETGAKDSSATLAFREKAAAEARRMINSFLEQTGWHPSKIKGRAGALLYSKYNLLVRFIMRRGASPTKPAHRWHVERLRIYRLGQLDQFERSLSTSPPQGVNPATHAS